ncbi:MAG: glycosyltransferase family 4 protein [Gammaproteobacteria bacterium]
MIANTGWYLRNFRAKLVERLEAEGYKVILAAPPDGETNNAFFQKRTFVPLRLSRKGRNPLAELLALSRVISLFRRVRPDLVLTWTPKPNIYGGIAGRLLHVPVIPNVAGLGVVFIRGGAFSRLVGWFYRFAFAHSPVVYFQNEEDRAAFINFCWVEKAKTKRLPGSGVDLGRFHPQPIPPIEPFVFLYIGRLLADKGVRELVEAARQLRAAGRYFVVRFAGTVDAGNPTTISRQELDSWVADGIIEYLGPLDDVRPALVLAHCVVLPSYYREGVPRSLLEAAAMGRPLITTNAPGCLDAVLPGKSGFLCEPRSSDSLADCMARMLDLDPQELTAMGRTGREYMERCFSEEIVLDAYLNQCRLLIQNKREDSK